MKSANKQSSRSAQSWISRVKGRPPPKADYNYELRDWLQHVVMEAEKDRDFKKKEQFLKLLENLSAK